jgi:IS30 family transposase
MSKSGQPQTECSLGAYKPIAARPAIADTRSDVGCLEGDLIVAARKACAIVTVSDRAGRYCWLADFPEDHRAEATLGALLEISDRIPCQHRLTLTWDQRREMARWADLEASWGIETYLAEPHHPWQRSTNEAGNALLRRYAAKGSDLGVYGPGNLRAIETRINTMPHPVLAWSTAQTLYTTAVAITG